MNPHPLGWPARLRSALRSPHPIERATKYRFRNSGLLRAALTHRSYRFEHPETPVDNQRLEFLGDAVLALLTARTLYERFPDHDEGMLTALRAQLASRDALAEIASALGVGAFLFLGKGEEKSAGRERTSNLTDALEALFGAVYLDGGMRAAEGVFRRLFSVKLHELTHDAWAGNPKGQLQELAQRFWRMPPTYRVVSRTGPEHRSTFTVEVRVGEHLTAQGTGGSKREAESRAAAAALMRIEQTKPPP